MSPKAELSGFDESKSPLDNGKDTTAVPLTSRAHDDAEDAMQRLQDEINKAQGLVGDMSLNIQQTMGNLQSDASEKAEQVDQALKDQLDFIMKWGSSVKEEVDDGNVQEKVDEVKSSVETGNAGAGAEVVDNAQEDNQEN